MNSEQENFWIFRLFVSGKTPKTDQAVALLQQICETYLDGRCSIEVIDIVENPIASIEENIIATPTLLKNLPKPARRIIGDLLDRDQLMMGLDIRNEE